MTTKNGYADLHVHTNASDSTFGPDEVILNAKLVGLSAVGITDHDTVDSLDRALLLGKEAGVEVIPGIELSAEEGQAEIHILGYFINHKDPVFAATLKMLRESRLERAKEIIRKLKGQNVNIELEDVLKLTESYTSVGRLHIARALKDAKHVSTIGDAFRRYIGQNGPAYVGKHKMSPREVIRMIKAAGGAAVLAHPVVLNNDELVKSMIPMGLDGIEVYHTEHNTAAVERYKAMAQANGLAMTGGSDCHGMSKNKMLLGTILIPYEYVEQLRLRAGAR